MIFPARLAVLGAIACTMWFNGCYGFSKGQTLADQSSLVALALTIDLCKAAFLPAASFLWQRRRFLPAIVLIILWPFALTCSTFAGYAYLVTHRTAAAAGDEAKQSRRSRAQSDYDRAKSDLATAEASPLWQSSAACTAPKTRKELSFCESISPMRSAVATTSDTLNTLPLAQPDPDLSTLNRVTGLALPDLQLLVSFFPAMLIELVASVGSYAVFGSSRPEASRTPVNPFRSPRRPVLPPQTKTDPPTRLDALPQQPNQTRRDRRPGSFPRRGDAKDALSD